MNSDLRPAHFPSTGTRFRRILHEAAVSGRTRAERLIEIRRAAGYASAVAAARAIGTPKVTYQHHESGTRAITDRSAEVYAAHFGVPASLILYGDTPIFARDVPIRGAIGDRGVVISRMRTEQALPSTTPAPPFGGQKLQALIVQTDDLFPAYRRGDVVFYHPPTPPDPAISGRECVVETWGGEKLLCIAAHDPASNTWSLTSYQNEPRSRVRLRKLAPVAWVQKAALPAPSRQ